MTKEKDISDLISTIRPEDSGSLTEPTEAAVKTWRASLPVKLLTVISGIVVGLSVALFIYQVQNVRQEVIAHYTNESYQLSNQLADDISHLENKTTENLLRLLKQARVSSGYSQLVFSMGDVVLEAGLAEAQAASVERTLYFSGGSARLKLVFPDVNAEVFSRTSRLMLWIVALMLFSIVLLFVVVRTVIADSFKETLRGARAITEGDWNLRLDAGRKDEFGVLATFFNQMLDSLVGHQQVMRRALKQLRHSEARLEDEVKERTLALEQTAIALSKRERLLSEYAQVTSQAKPTHEKICLLLQLGCDLLDLDEAYFWEIHADNYQISVHYPEDAKLDEGAIMRFQKSLYANMLEKRSSIVFSHSDDSALRGYTHRLGVESYVGVPVYINGEINGSLNFFSMHDRDRYFSEEDVSFIELCSDWTGSTLTRERQEKLIFQQKERALVTLQSIGDGVITTDADGMIEYLNPVAEKLTGWSSEEALGHPLEDVFRIVDEHSLTPIVDPVRRCLEEDSIVSMESSVTLMHRDGHAASIEISASPIRGREGKVQGAVVIFHDVSSAREMANQLMYQANHDFLTGLINRHEFDSRLNLALESAKEHDYEHALCYLDLDQFKIVNDTCGHVAGDQLLKQITTLLSTHVRESDTLARLGGDEFGYLLERCPLKKAEQIAENVRGVIKDFRFVWEDKTFEVGVSIGLVPITNTSLDSSTIMSAADTACYAAKEKGRDRVHVYQPGDVDLARRHGEMQWVLQIQEALEKDRLVLYWQPIVPTAEDANEAPHYEILLRMRDIQGQLIDPGSFIAAAERYDLMPSIDRWVIRKICESAAAIPSDSQYANCQFSINLSGATVDDERLLDYITDLFVETELSPGRFCFEVTETAAIANLGGAIRLINELKNLGCSFSLDDFGSGFSSFAYLKNLPVDYLKIDGSLVKDMENDPIDYAMVKSISQIGKALGVKTVAEYVETRGIFEMLQELGVDYAQGYWVSRPKPLAIDARHMLAG